jgi:hypothetical protein
MIDNPSGIRVSSAGVTWGAARGVISWGRRRPIIRQQRGKAIRVGGGDGELVAASQVGGLHVVELDKPQLVRQRYWIVCALLPHPLITYFASLSKRRKFSRKRPNEDTGDITYINEKNRIFNKKVELSSIFARVGLIPYTFSQITRYFDKYTAEIRTSFECGTALRDSLLCQARSSQLYHCISVTVAL